MDVRDKKVIITGGANGLGLAMVHLFAAQGARVSVFDVNSDALLQLQQSLPKVHGFVCDVSNDEQVANAVENYSGEFGSADVLINNAGILHSEPLIRITPTGLVKHDVETWQRVLQTDLSSVFYMTRGVVEKMIQSRTRGVVVNVSSVAASGSPGASAYAAAKAGINALTSSWARELGPLGIRIVAVAPGFMETESASNAMSKTALDEVVNRVALRRLGKPEEIANAVLTVVQNDFFNGKVFEVDGGLTI